MRPLLSAAIVAGLAALGGGCATPGQAPGTDPAPGAAAAAAGLAAAEGTRATNPTAAKSGPIVERFGVRLVGVNLSASGFLIDLRYRVLDPVKARPLLDRRVRPVLVDEASGDRFYVPVPPIVGAMRQTARNNAIRTDRTYFMLFANPDRRLHAGSKVTLYLGDEKFADLRVGSL